MKKEVLIGILIISVLVIAGCTSKVKESPPIEIGEGESEGEGPGLYATKVCSTDSDCEYLYIKTLYLNDSVYFDTWIIRLDDIEGSNKVKIEAGELGNWIYWYPSQNIFLNEIGLEGALIIQPIQISPETGSAVVKIAREDNLALNGEILDIDEPINIDGNTIELMRINVGRYEEGIGTRDNDLRTLYGTIIENPKSHSPSDEVILQIPQEQIKANVRLSSVSPILGYEPYRREGGMEGAVTALTNLITGKVTVPREMGRQLILGSPLQSEQGFPEIIIDDDLTGLQDSTITFNGRTYKIHDEIVWLNNNITPTQVETGLSSEDDYDTLITSRNGKLGYYYRFDTSIDLSQVTNENPLNITFLDRELSIIDVGSDNIEIQNLDGTAERHYNSAPYELLGEVSSALLMINGEYYPLEMGESVIIDDTTVTLINVGSGSANICVENEFEEDCGVISLGDSRTMLGLDILVADINVDEQFFEWSWILYDLFTEDPTIGIISNIGNPLLVEQCDRFPDSAISLCFDSLTSSIYNTYAIKYNPCRDLRINGCLQTFDLTSDLDNGYILLADGINGLSSNTVVDEIYLEYESYNVKVYYSQNNNINYAGTVNQNAFAKKTGNEDIKFTISSILHNVNAILTITTLAENVDENIDIMLGIQSNNFNGLGYTPQNDEYQEIVWSDYISPDYISAIININNMGYSFEEEGISLIDNILIRIVGINEDAQRVFAGIESVNKYLCGQNEVIAKDISYNCLNYQCHTDLNSFKTVDSCEAPEYCIEDVACCTRSPPNFFPITSWHTGNQISSLQTLNDIGFNSFVSSDLGLSNLDTLKEAENYRLKHFLSGTYTQGRSDANDVIDQENVLNDVNQYCSYSSLSKYYLNDEPYVNEVNEMAASTYLLNRFDPEHPGIAAYNLAYDYLTYSIHPNELYIDHYPIVKDLPRETALNEKIPLWFIAQAFGTRDPQTLDQIWTRMPSSAELREMVYLALAYGAKGISYYRYNSGVIYSEGRFYDGLTREDGTEGPLFNTVETLNNELTQLAPTLLNLDSLAVCNSRTLTPNNEPLSACKDCSYGNWYIEKSDIEIIENIGKSITFDFEKPDSDTDYSGVFYQFSRINAPDFPYIKIDYEIFENNGTSLHFQPVRGGGILSNIPMPSSVGKHTFYTYLDDLKGIGMCNTYRYCVDCISPSCEENVSISLILGDIVDFILEEGETAEVSSYKITITDIRWNGATIKIEYGQDSFSNFTLNGQNTQQYGLTVRLDEVNRITSRPSNECTERCESDETQLRFYFYAREQGNSMKLKINDITTAYCHLPFVTEATQDVEVGNFKDNYNKKYIMLVNRNSLNQITTTITFSPIVTETRLTDMLTNQVFQITGNRASIPLTPGHGRLLRLDIPS